MIASFSALLLGAAALTAALPTNDPITLEARNVTSLNQGAFEEAQQRDATATRVFSAVPIKTSDDRCLFVDLLGGDFRANLAPILVVACDGSTGQQWDIITNGKHNDQTKEVLVVNVGSQACLNFDGRRAAGNQVVTFSCGGRADGSGGITNSQQFAFNGTAGPLPLEPNNSPGTCFVVKGNTLDQAACNPGDANQAFTIGTAGAVASNSSVVTASASSASASSSTSSSSSIAVTEVAATNAAAACTATAVTVTSMVKVTEKVTEKVTVTETVTAACAGAAAAAETTAAAVVLTTKKVEAAAETTVAKSMGGGKDKSTVTKTKTKSMGGGKDKSTTTKAAEAGKDKSTTKAAGAGKDKTTVTKSVGAAAAKSSISACPSLAVVTTTLSAGRFSNSTSTVAAAQTTAKTDAAAQITSKPSGPVQTNPTTPVPVSRAGGTLNPAAAAEANQRDATATRAFSSVSLRSADGKCLAVDPTAGDFRQEIIPIGALPCDGSTGQLWDFITAGKHNDAKNSTLIVNTLVQGCLNFDSRRAVGDTVILFSCGGRADGDSGTTDSQLFPFVAGQKTIVLTPENSRGAICLTPKGALLDEAACTGDAGQIFSIV